WMTPSCCDQTGHEPLRVGGEQSVRLRCGRVRRPDHTIDRRSPGRWGPEASARAREIGSSKPTKRFRGASALAGGSRLTVGHGFRRFLSCFLAACGCSAGLGLVFTAADPASSASICSTVGSADCRLGGKARVSSYSEIPIGLLTPRSAY